MSEQLLESLHVVSAIVPINTTGAAAAGDWISMKGYRRMLCIIQQGAWAGGTPALTFAQATAAAGTGTKALSYTKRYDGVALTQDILTSAAVTSDTSNLSSTANSFVVVEFHEQDLDRANGFYYVQINVASPGANADLISAIVILGDPHATRVATLHQTAIT